MVLLKVRRAAIQKSVRIQVSELEASPALSMLTIFRKHWLRHMKPYRCIVTGCQRRDGFSTRNDLDRHRKSLHKIATRNKTDKTYRCAAPNCNKKAKIWPRLDNFRQHCARTHRDLPTDELVKQSLVLSADVGYQILVE